MKPMRVDIGLQDRSKPRELSEVVIVVAAIRAARSA